MPKHDSTRNSITGDKLISKLINKNYEDGYDRIFKKEIIYNFKYTNGTTYVRRFEDQHEAEWFIQNEGDHLLSYSRVKC